MLEKSHHQNPAQQPAEEIKDQPALLPKLNYLLPTAIIFASLLVSASILYSGKLFIQKLAPGSGLLAAAGSQNNIPPAAPSAAPAAQPDSGPVKVSVDDDAVLGSKNAPVTIIEFSDYECPFCKRAFTDTISSLKKEYIDTGKVKLVYRDLPLSFHQNANKEAQAAECARSQGGDATYYKYHDQIFTRTTSNGTGLALDQLPVIAKDLGLNVNQFNQCLSSEKYKAEVDKDTADASAVGASGTPTWFIGKSSADGTITATKVVGAQPYASLKIVIDQVLSK